MNPDVQKVAKWARANHWTVTDDAKGYTHFHDPKGNWITYYPATPSRPAQRMARLVNELPRGGLEWPPPSKSEQRSRRRRGD